MDRKYCEYDYLEDDSDQDRGLDSSEDEIDVILHGTPKQKRKLSRSLSQGSLQLSSSEDDFEKEMELELEESLKQHEQQQFMNAAKDVAAKTSKKEIAGPSSQSVETVGQEKSKRQYYDDIYFDSDEEDENLSSKTGNDDKTKKAHTDTSKGKRRRHVLSNDELFYDPSIDDNNQKWVDNQRSRYHLLNPIIPATSPELENHVENSPQAGVAPIKSDAILNCPACMTTLCLDCQRHEVYPTQYRAMFVLNCCIIRSERLKYKAGQTKKRKWKKSKRGRDDESGQSSRTTDPTDEKEEFFHPVKCSECNTEVAVLDDDEVYHFFNVLAGIA